MGTSQLRTRTDGNDAQDGADGSVVSHGDPTSELMAIESALAIADTSGEGLFRLSGKNAAQFLHGLVTNEIKGLADGVGTANAFLNVKGRVEAVADVFRLGDGYVLACPANCIDQIASNLGRFTRAGGFDLARCDGVASLAVLGPEAPRALATLIGATVGVLQCREVELEGARLWLLGRRRCAGPAVDVAGDPHQVERLWTRLVELGATPAGELALEWARLKAGLPRFMADYDQDSVVLEADDPALVSFSKGCYLGQEIVARVHYQGQPAQLVRCLHMDGNELPEPGDVVLLCADGGDKPVGHVTSAALVPGTGAIVLAMIKRRAFTPGTRVRIVRGGRELAATVAARETVRALRESA